MKIWTLRQLLGFYVDFFVDVILLLLGPKQYKFFQ